MTFAWWFALVLLGQDASHRKLVTADGVALALYRYGPPHAQKAPLLLVPDVGFNRIALDASGSGLAPKWARTGRSVYVVELQGQGASAAGSPDAGSVWNAWATRDVKAALEAIRIETGAVPDLFVQGYVGAVVLGAASVELAGLVRKLVVVSPSVEPIPAPPLVRLVDRGCAFEGMSAQATTARDFFLLFTKGSTFPGRSLDVLSTRGFSNLPVGACREWKGWLSSGRFFYADGSLLTARMARLAVPTLAWFPLGDSFSPPEAGNALREVAPPQTLRLRTLSRALGAAEDFSHAAVVAGTSLAADLVSPSADFLDEREAP